MDRGTILALMCVLIYSPPYFIREMLQPRRRPPLKILLRQRRERELLLDCTQILHFFFAFILLLLHLFFGVDSQSIEFIDINILLLFVC